MEAILIVSIFILCFSNETFEVLASSTDNKPEGFNKVYDGKITEAGWAEFTAELPAGTKVKVTVSTGISKLVVDGKPVDVYSLDGKLVRSQAKSLNGLKGVYVINGKTVMLK